MARTFADATLELSKAGKVVSRHSHDCVEYIKGVKDMAGLVFGTTKSSVFRNAFRHDRSWRETRVKSMGFAQYKTLVGIFMGAFAFQTSAQTPPFIVNPLEGSHVLFLMPGSKSDCTITESFMFGGQSAQGHKTSVFEYLQDASNKKNYFGLGTKEVSGEMKLVFEGDARGASLLANDPELRMATPLSPKEQANVMPMLRPMLNLVRGWVNSVLGRTLSQGSIIDFPIFDVCQIAAGSPGKPMSGTTKVSGETEKDGRRFVVLESNFGFACAIKGNAFDMSLRSWYSYDIESGLPADKYEIGTATIQGVGPLTTTTDQRCKVTSPVMAKSGNPTNTTVSRLTELKSFYEKGLISKEIYEQRAREILNGL